MNVCVIVFTVSVVLGLVSQAVLRKVSSRQKYFKEKNNVSVLGGAGILLVFASAAAFLYVRKDISLPGELSHIFACSAVVFFSGLLDDSADWYLRPALVVQNLR